MSAIAQNSMSLEEVLSKFPAHHPLARDVPEWLASFNKTFQDASRWELVIEPLTLCYRAYVSVQFEDETTLNKTFKYNKSEFEKGQDNGNG